APAPGRLNGGRGPSGDDVGGQLVLDVRDTVAEHELALLQSLDLEDVGSRGALQRLDGRIEVAVLLAQPGKLRPQLSFFLLGHTCRSVRATLSCGCRNDHANAGVSVAYQQSYQ